MGKLIIIKKKHCLLLFFMDEQRHPQAIRVTALPEREEVTGNIYVGRVAEIHSGIQAAFVTFGADTSCKAFLPLQECREPMLLSRDYDGKLKQGDELLIQISVPALKGKQPVATTELTLIGRYCICKRGGHKLNCSGKLDKNTAADLKRAVREEKVPGYKDYKWILRTNAGALNEPTPLFEEMKKFIAFFQNLEQIYPYRSLYSCLYHTEPELLSVLKDMPISEYEEIVTDDPSLYELLHNNTANIPVRFYQDELLPLDKLYSIETHLKEALGSRVWLKCGGYLVIEPTEAMIVIDVNSGKAQGDTRGMQARNYFRKVNLEAAQEVARQLRLRNYSGMIMVDFINMDSPEDNQELLRHLAEYLRQDFVQTRLVDMTPLGIVEITRKKVSIPLAEFFKDNCRDFVDRA